AANVSTGSKLRNCKFQLRIGDVLPFTGGLAAYGGNLDRAVKLAVDMQNASLKRLKLNKKMSVRLVASEDGQTQASASVEAATKPSARPSSSSSSSSTRSSAGRSARTSSGTSTRRTTTARPVSS